TIERIAIPGPLCMATETSVLGRSPPPMASSPVGVVRGAIETGTPQQAVQAIGDTLWRWQTPAEKGGFVQPDADSIAKAIAARYAALDVSGRAILLALLPTGAKVPAMAPVDEAVRLERDPVALAFVLLTRVTDPADPLLDAAAGAGAGAASAPVARLAE